jgi:hypothetical protein
LVDGDVPGEVMDVPERAPAAVLELAPDVAMARVARAATSACGTLAGFTVDRLADVRLVVDEVFNMLVVVGTGPIRLCLASAGAVVELEMSAERRDERGWRIGEFDLVRLLVEVTADRAAFDDHGGRLTLGATFGPAPA